MYRKGSDSLNFLRRRFIWWGKQNYKEAENGDYNAGDDETSVKIWDWYTYTLTCLPNTVITLTVAIAGYHLLLKLQCKHKSLDIGLWIQEQIYYHIFVYFQSLQFTLILALHTVRLYMKSLHRGMMYIFILKYVVMMCQQQEVFGEKNKGCKIRNCKRQ